MRACPESLFSIPTSRMAEILGKPGTHLGMVTGHSKIARRGEYLLDLDDTFKFPDMNNIPVAPPDPGESWYILTEIHLKEQTRRPTFIVWDKIVPNFWVVAFHTEHPWEDSKYCVPGSMLCIKDGIPKRFSDGRAGYQIEDPSTILILPCTIKKLRELNDSLRKRFEDGVLRGCVVCDKGPQKDGCAECKTRYCSKVCQKRDWPAHKPICQVLKTLHKWNRTD
ncbi:hypothetical protein BKA70DRAFT_1293800 [Coprinopsis sp. MPI-PUGE-AT-0042]|nr:hypothetical protein BKA70DRAFT_1293800 [Coprinopsis sp. MPI-PUGE-AT-0042]